MPGAVSPALVPDGKQSPVVSVSPCRCGSCSAGPREHAHCYGGKIPAAIKRRRSSTRSEWLMFRTEIVVLPIAVLPPSSGPSHAKWLFHAKPVDDPAGAVEA